MPRYTKKRKITHRQVMKALGGPNKKFIREGRGFEIKSPINDAITWQAIADFGTIENTRMILNQDGQEAQANDSNAHVSYIINKHKVQLHGRNCGAQPCMMKFWVLTNLSDIYGETNSITGSVNPIGTSTNPNMQEICMQDLVYGWDVQMQSAQTITTFTPDADADGNYYEQTGDLNTSNWGLTSGTAPNAGALVLYNHDNPAAGVTNTPTYCLSRANSLGLHNSKDFLNKWQILKKGDFKLNPGDDYYINVNVPHLHYKSRPPFEAQSDDVANAGLIYCFAKKGIVILTKAMGCLGINSTVAGTGIITSKSGYMKCQIPFEWRESAQFYKMDDVDLNLGVQLYATDDVENTTLSAGTNATYVSGDTGL